MSPASCDFVDRAALPCDLKDQSEITQHAVSIWIDSTPKNLLRRIGNISSRPLLTTGDPLQILTNLRERAGDL